MVALGAIKQSSPQTGLLSLTGSITGIYLIIDLLNE
jgi:hypothetical protein